MKTCIANVFGTRVNLQDVSAITKLSLGSSYLPTYAGRQTGEESFEFELILSGKEDPLEILVTGVPEEVERRYEEICKLFEEVNFYETEETKGMSFYDHLYSLAQKKDL